MPSPNHIPDDAFPESAIGPADLESPETPEAEPSQSTVLLLLLASPRCPSLRVLA